MAMIRLRHKTYEGLLFGPSGEIQFGPRGGHAPGELYIDSDHPLYDALWTAEGSNLEVVEDGPAKVYISPVDGTEIKSKQALLAHVRASAKAGNALARLWLAENGTERDRLEVAGAPTLTVAGAGPIRQVDVPSAPPAPVIEVPVPPAHALPHDR